MSPPQLPGPLVSSWRFLSLPLRRKHVLFGTAMTFGCRIPKALGPFLPRDCLAEVQVHLWEKQAITEETRSSFALGDKTQIRWEEPEAWGAKNQYAQFRRKGLRREKTTELKELPAAKHMALCKPRYSPLQAVHTREQTDCGGERPSPPAWLGAGAKDKYTPITHPGHSHYIRLLSPSF